MNTQRKILLINPRWTGAGRQKQVQFKRLWPPLSLATVAAMMRKKGMMVQVVDNNVHGLSLKTLAAMARGFDAVFVTSTPYDRWQCPSIDSGFFLRTARAIPASKLFILGGHVTQRPRDTLLATRARAAILGEPEQTMVELARGEKKLASIAGLAFLEDGGLVTTPARPFLSNLDELPMPALEILPMDRYHYFPVMGRPFTILELSRGCPVGCSFCYLGMHGKRRRAKSLKRSLEETRHAVDYLGRKNIYFLDLEFCQDRKFVEGFCEGIKKLGLKFQWACQTRVTDITPELARLMAAAGCRWVHLGVESGDEKILTQTGKGIRVSQARRAVDALDGAGVGIVMFFNLGWPGETLEQMKKTVDLAKELNPHLASFHLFVPFFDTPLARENRVSPADFPVDQGPAFCDFAHDPEMLKKELKSAYRQFYLRRAWMSRIPRLLKN